MSRGPSLVLMAKTSLVYRSPSLLVPSRRSAYPPTRLPLGSSSRSQTVVGILAGHVPSAWSSAIRQFPALALCSQMPCLSCACAASNTFEMSWCTSCDVGADADSEAQPTSAYTPTTAPAAATAATANLREAHNTSPHSRRKRTEPSWCSTEKVIERARRLRKHAAMTKGISDQCAGTMPPNRPSGANDRIVRGSQHNNPACVVVARNRRYSRSTCSGALASRYEKASKRSSSTP